TIKKIKIKYFTNTIVTMIIKMELDVMRRNKMPQVRGIDEGFNLVKQGYSYMLNRRRQLKSNVFEMRLFGKKVICMGGRNAAELFYDENKFERKGAIPN